MSIVIIPNIPLVAAQGATADVVLQPGSVISARVLQVLGSDQVRIAIGGQSLDVQSQVPLQAGQTLQLAVSQTSDGIQLAVVSQQGGASASPGLAGATAAQDSVTLAPDALAGLLAIVTPGTVPPNNPLTALQTLAVAVAAQSAATRQTSLAPLFANLDVAAGLSGLPPQIQQAVAQVLTQRTSLDQGLTGNDIKQAFQTSGLFLEASLASGSIPSSTAAPDLKAALIVLRQVLATSLADVTAAPTATLQPGATPATVVVPQPGATPTATAVPQGTTPPPTTPPGGASSTPALAQQPGTTPAVIVPEQGASSPVQISPQSVTIVVAPETAATAPSASAPPLAPEIIILSEDLPTGAGPSAPQDVVTAGRAGQIMAPAAMPADAAARTAVSSAALNLLQEALQASPLAAANISRLVLDNGQLLSLLPAVTGSRALAGDDTEFARTNVPPPPISGALPAAQPIAPATLLSNSPPEAALQHLLADTVGAIARQTLLQVASLPGLAADTTVARIDPASPRWNFEIPFVTPQGTAMAQFDISRDGGGNEVEAARQVWRARFSLDVEPSGPIHALVSLTGERTSVRMWAERPATARQLRAGVSELSQALSRAELQPGDIVIRDGAPVQPASARAGHFLDRAL